MYLTFTKKQHKKLLNSVKIQNIEKKYIFFYHKLIFGTTLVLGIIENQFV